MAGECESATPAASFTEQSRREHRPVWDGGAASHAASVRKKHAWTPTGALFPFVPIRKSGRAFSLHAWFWPGARLDLVGAPQASRSTPPRAPGGRLGTSALAPQTSPARLLVGHCEAARAPGACTWASSRCRRRARASSTAAGSTSGSSCLPAPAASASEPRVDGIASGMRDARLRRIRLAPPVSDAHV